MLLSNIINYVFIAMSVLTVLYAALRYVFFRLSAGRILAVSIEPIGTLGKRADNKSDKAKTGKIRKICTLILAELLMLLAVTILFAISYTVNTYGAANSLEIVYQLTMPLRGVNDDLVILFIQMCVLPTIFVMAGINLLMFVMPKIPKVPTVIFHIAKPNRMSTPVSPPEGGEKTPQLPSKQSEAVSLPSKQKQATQILLPNLLKKMFLPVSVYLFVYSIWMSDHSIELSAIYDQIATQSTFIEENYVAPKDVEITFPYKKNNLIHIYFESLESTFFEANMGGAMPADIIPEVARIMNENIYFSSNELFGGAHQLTSSWTVAGMVAQTAGIPIMHLPGKNNEAARNGELLPNAYSLGQILQDNGYTNTLMIGSDAVFGNRDAYFRTHGNYKIMDYFYAIEQGVIDSDYHVWWGFEDEILYDWAKQELLLLSGEEAPFNLTLLTVDTHHVSGYVCGICKTDHNIFPDERNNQYANVFSCASRQLCDFVKWIGEQDFYKDTTIVITGDHASMDPHFFDDLRMKYDRRLPFIIINPVVTPRAERTINRGFSSFDIFPTTLTALGVEIEGDRLGLGVNLYSGKPTLVETYGIDYAFHELRKLSLFYNATFW